MPNFAYIARDQAGQKVTGTLTNLAGEDAALAELQSRHLAPVTIRPVRPAPVLQQRISMRQRATMFTQLADLLKAGVPLLRALRLVGRTKSTARLSAIMSDVADEVADGEPLADAMAKHGSVFPPIHVAVVRAGERGGFLDIVLARLGSFLEQQADMRSRVIGGLIYPVMVLGFGVLLIIVALVYFVPRFEGLFKSPDLPMATKLLLGTSNLLTERWPMLLVGVAVLVTAVVWLLRQANIRRSLLKAQLRVPVIGSLVRGLAVSRFARTLGMLLDNGIPMLSAMQISRDAVGHALMAEAIDAASDAVRRGESLAGPLSRSGLFEEEVVEIIGVGESANNLPEVLLRIAETQEKRVERWLATIIRLMEPLLLLVLAAMVVFIFLALVLPLMRMGSSL
jgi:general secretion pathway protein F